LQNQQNEQRNEMRNRFETQQTSITELQNIIQTIQNTQNNTIQTPNTRPRKKPYNTQENNLAFDNQINQTSNQQSNTQQNDTMSYSDLHTQNIKNQPQSTNDIHLNLNPNNQQNNAHESPIIDNSSPYNSVFNNTQDMIGLSPINNTSPNRTESNTNNLNNSMIDLTTQISQNDIEIICPRNLSNSFPSSTQDDKNTKNQDLGNHFPGYGT
jgi:hypothetical protein